MSNSTVKRPKRLIKKKVPKRSRKEEKPVRPRGFDALLSSISRAGRGESQDSTVMDPPKAIRKTDKRNIPSGLHFNKAEKNFKDEAKRFGKPKRNEDSDECESSDPQESEPDSTPVAPKHRSRANSTSSSSSSSSSSSNTTSSSLNTTSSGLSPSSSSSSSSSSSLDNSADQRKKRKKRKAEKGKKKKAKSKRRRKEDHMLKRVKIDALSVYNGRPDIDAFGKWALEV